VDGNPVSVNIDNETVVWDVTYTASFDTYNGYIIYFWPRRNRISNF
jgi:hypothetical protein